MKENTRLDGEKERKKNSGEGRFEIITKLQQEKSEKGCVQRA